MTTRKSTKQEKWKPGVPKQWLLLLAGLLWFGVGCMLDGFAGSWLKTEALGKAALLAALGFACALIIHHFGFLRIVDKNLARILPMQGKRCVFSFMPFKSYILILIMSLMGAALRHSALPRPYLAVLYMAIGTALILSSIRYFRTLIKSVRGCI
ncbi:MAG: hypothetical protein K9N55_06345 [Phycisphaerae bacterium]|nr:hypothetical protein [Phycisphaerae bacterium]